MADRPVPLNLQPRGLLDFFGIKDGQWGPRTLGGELVPQLDLWRHYVASNAVDLDSDNQNLVAGGLWVGVGFGSGSWGFGGPSATVPQNELWYFDALTLTAGFTVGAGSTLTHLTAIQRPPAGLSRQQFPFPPIPLVTSGTVEGVGTAVSMLYPFWMLPGMTFEFQVSAVIAATETLTLRAYARIARLRI